MVQAPMGETPLVEAVTMSGGRLDIRPGLELRALLAADPWVVYPVQVDLPAVPPSVLLQTAAYLLAPVAWAHGLAVTVTGVDASVAAALPRLRAELQRMYPGLPWAGHVRVVEPVAPAPLPQAGRGRSPTGLMLSGGVDSLASALRHPDGTLLTLTVALDDEVALGPARLARTAVATEAFAAAHGHDHRLITTNARSMVPAATTRRLRPTVQHWWSEVSHAMSLAGLAAPALWSAGAQRLLIASSDVPGHDSRWGSSARLDPLIGLGPIAVEHDAHDAQRLAKVRRIVAAAGAVGSVDLRVCYKGVPDGRLNCGVCEKCLRTQAALVLCGADPARFGFPDPAACALALTPAEWHARATQATRGTVIHWDTMGRAARELDASAWPAEQRAFVAWIATLEARRPPLGDPTAPPSEPLRMRPSAPAPGAAGRFRRWTRRLADRGRRRRH